MPIRFEYAQVHMGVRTVITGYAPDPATADKAAAAAYARFAQLDAIMSDYRKDSELMLLDTSLKPISTDLRAVLERALEVARLSDGAFDFTAGPLVQLWREARKTRRLPDAAKLDQAKETVGWKLVELTPEGAKLAKEGMRLDLGGIAKGYACDQALIALAQNGVDRALVEAGGDMAASGAPPGKIGWKVEVRNLRDRVFWLRNGALSTSGDSEQHVDIAGKRYSHILDPRTGFGLTTRRQVTVLAEDGLTSDPLATALSVLGPAKAQDLVGYYQADAHFVQD
ncbi:MAG TPA: FAD:protein FMN transferase [Fimbriimonas sp.]